ncbi:unnamed protein product [Adineta steineri]|uniref:Angiotensin-converting enzyme n=1 Tax=Adineta steineri TaxID=433720 RepID=A0A813S805_9BILA|nr:unnamed protein product [Adineta steineri]CAF0893480.1 unnamed protein product [Adineta steineri]
MGDEINGNVQDLIAAKAAELFNSCDTEQKGFIIRKDMQRLRDELGVEPEQLEDVFDSLDNDHNGFLTLEEFTSGFGMFLGNQMECNNEDEQELIEHIPDDKEEEQVFHHTLETLGAKDLYEDEETIMGLWVKLRETDPVLLRQFEQFIGQATEEIKRSKSDHRSIEAALHSKSSVYDDEIKRLYDEMEQQIKIEKSKVLEEEKLKERELREQMEEELRIKEQQLAEVIKTQRELELKLLHTNLNETETKNDNERLQKEKIELEQQLQDIARNFEESKHYISQLQIQTKKEKRDRAKHALSLTENLAIERENLVKELDTLKSLNKRLVDERDVHHGGNSQGRDLSSSHSTLKRQGSVLSDYFTAPHRGNSEPEEDDDVMSPSNNDESESDTGSTQNRNHIRNRGLGARQQPVGANAVFQHSELMNVAPNAVPDRMFKIAFIGDSGVGKTSFIQRFCTDNFNEAFSATIGVDLQAKMLNIDNRVIALQLWDTAGQERFRSITKQYFRKSDGIILVYDVSSEVTFRNVRAWMTSVQELAEEDCVIALVGNKTDLCNDDDQRPVKYKDGAKLADEYQCLFFESSARLGTSVIEIMEAIARLMQEKDDRLRKGENIIDVSSKTKKREHEEIVECNDIEIDNDKLDKMSMKEQEEYVISILNEYDKNLTTLAYITSSAEFETHLYLNDTNRKRITEKYYESYRGCLKTIATMGRKFKGLMNNNHSSVRWLLIRTQAIGDAGETNTVIKNDLQKLKGRIKEIYHKKFTWNTTRLGIDEVPEVLGSLESPDDLLALWNATYEVPISMRDHYATLIAVQNQQAKQNRLNDKTDSTTNNEERRIVEQLWQELKPLHRLLHAYVRQQMSKLYPGLIQLDQPIPVHLTKDIFGSMMTYLEKDVLPFPHIKGIDLGPSMKRKNFTEEKIFHYADEFFTSLNLTEAPDKFWNLSVFKKIPDRHMGCHPAAFDMYKHDDVRIRMCTSLTSRDFYVVHHEMGHIQHYLQYKSLPFWFRRSPHGAFSEAIGDAIALAAMSPTHLKRIGLLENYASSREDNIKFLFSQGLSRLFLPPYAYALDIWRWSVYNGSIQPFQYNKQYWNLVCKYQGMKPAKPRHEKYFDAGTKLHVAFDLSYIKYFLAHVFQFQIFDVLCQEAGHTGPLHLCDLHGSIAAGKKLKILLGLGSSKPWEDLLEEFAGIRTFSAKSCLRYFQPLRDYLEELVAKGELTVGWTCDEANKSNYKQLFHIKFILFLLMNMIFSMNFL